MATFRKRTDKRHVQIRKWGCHSITKTFSHKKDALSWAIEIERQIARGEYVSRIADQLETLGGLLERYSREIISRKRGVKFEIYRLGKMQRHPIASISLQRLTSYHISQYRNDRLKEVSGTTVKKELQLISHALEVARMEWGLKRQMWLQM